MLTAPRLTGGRICVLWEANRGFLLKAGTSVGSNCEEASAGQTKADFIAKLAIARKECRESLYWLRLIAAQRLLDPAIVLGDISEARQLTAILRAIIVKSRMSDRRG